MVPAASAAPLRSRAMYTVTDDLAVHPPRPLRSAQTVPLNQLWKVLPEPNRGQVLATLTRIVAQRLPKPEIRREVDHDLYG